LPRWGWQVTGELGLTVRTLFVSVFVLDFAAFAVPVQELATLNSMNLLWLGLYGVTTAYMGFLLQGT
jgi:transporter family protein